MSGEAFLKPWIPPLKKPPGSWFRSGTFTGSKQNYENKARASRSVMPIEAVRAVRSSDESNKPWNAGNRFGASYLRAASAKRSVMPWVNGNRWKFISRDAQIEIDNNLVENAIRPTALGKKNWLFFGDADAGERSAIIYSIIESCRRHDIEPYTYLHDVW